MQDYEYIFKILLLGDRGVGKTSIVNSLEGVDKGPLISLFNITFKELVVDGIKTNLQIWDPNEAVTDCWDQRKKYYYGSSGVLLVFDIANPESFKGLEWWMSLLTPLSKKPELIIVGNKIELNGIRKVSYEEAYQYAEKMGVAYFETSAISDYNVDVTFGVLVKSILEKISETEIT